MAGALDKEKVRAGLRRTATRTLDGLQGFPRADPAGRRRPRRCFSIVPRRAIAATLPCGERTTDARLLATRHISSRPLRLTRWSRRFSRASAEEQGVAAVGSLSARASGSPADAARTAGPPVGSSRRPDALDQARRLHGPGHWRQQDAQARIPRGRRPRAGRRHADHLGRIAIQPRAPNRGRGGEARAEVRARAGGARLAVDRRLSPQRQRPARPPARRHGEVCATRQLDDGRDRDDGRRGAARRRPALCHSRRRLERHRRAGLCRLRAGNPAAGGGARRQDRPRRACDRQQRHAGRH